MHTFLVPQHAPKKPMPNLEQENPDVEIIDSGSEHAQQNSELASPMPESEEIFSRYLSDLPDDGDDDDNNNKCPGGGGMSQGEEEAEEDIPKFSARVREPPFLKRRRHAIPVRVVRKKRREEKHNKLEAALVDMEKLVASTKDVFDAGRNGLQAYRARAIQSHLHMVVRDGRKHVEASQIVAESQQFAKIWGGKLVRQWVKDWVDKRELPTSS